MVRKAVVEGAVAPTLDKQLLDILIKGLEIEWKQHIKCVNSGSDYSVNQCATCARLRNALPLLKVLYPELTTELLNYKI